jgi:CxxC-x17-CxxC domain-containing protein
MAAKILHFGEELSDRLPLLRSSGYSVNRYERILEFRQALETRVEHDAVSMSELGEDLSPLVVLAARTYSTAPLILFRTQSLTSFPAGGSGIVVAEPGSEADYDLIVSASAPSGAWIGDVAALIARSRELRNKTLRVVQQSAQLREELEVVREQIRFQVQRGRLECARNAPAEAESGSLDSGSLIDRVLSCSRCGLEFVFTAGEQLFFQKRNFLNDPKVCKRCRSERKSGVARARPEITLTCAECGILTSVPFKPTQGRPVLCRSCFEKHRVAV